MNAIAPAARDELDAGTSYAPEPAAAAPAPPGRAPSAYQSETITKLVTALAEATKDFGTIEKNRENPHHKAKYANLVSIIDATAIPLAENGLVMTQTCHMTASGLVLVTRLMHVSGEWLASHLPLISPTDPQRFGSHMTYMKRYARGALLSVAASEDDDDGEAASGRGADKRQGKRRQDQQQEQQEQEPPAAPEPSPWLVIKGGVTSDAKTSGAWVAYWQKVAKSKGAQSNPDGFRKWLDDNQAIREKILEKVRASGTEEPNEDADAVAAVVALYPGQKPAPTAE